jgi:tetratricopeptide (TPR) repeat protein/ADP-heptose:LPS heptosyltransferase
MTKLASAFRAGVQYHHAGDYPRAEEHYREVLADDPQHADAWHLLGVVAHQSGRHQQAIENISRAIALNPNEAAYHSNLGAAQAALGRHADAVVSYQRALELKPDLPHAHSNMGNSLRELQNLPESLIHLQRAVELKPDFVEAQNNLGSVLKDLGKLDEAAAAFQNAVRLKPSYVEALHNLGCTLRELGKLDEAAVTLQQAVALRPNYAEAMVSLGIVLKKQKKFEEALGHFQRALELQPDLHSAHNSMGNVLQDLGRLEEAVASYRRALVHRPNYVEALNNLAAALSHLKRMDEATETVHQALRLQPNYVDANFNLAQIRLLQGNFAQGWSDYEWRWQLKDFGRRGFREPDWDGSSLVGKTILVHAEQGLGDTLQFVRLLPLVKERGGTVLFECQKVLTPLLERCAGFDQLIPQGTGIPPFDVQISLLSLPRVLGITLENLPADVPYIEADELLAEYWRRELGRENSFNVGIVWQGNPFPPVDRFRSIALQEYAPLSRVPGVRLFSLQKGTGSEQLSMLAEPFPVVDLGRHLDLGAGAFLDTAAVMSQLDLVISSDTAAVHLAGALGAPVWMPLSSAADWRWLLHREDSPWYPSMRLFRQSQLGRWNDVFQRMAGELQRMVSNSPPRPSEMRATKKIKPQVVPQLPVPEPAKTAALNRAIELHRSGDLPGAEEAYKRCLAIGPRSAAAWHLYAALSHQTGRPQQAIDCLHRAIAINPQNGDDHCNLGAACAETGHFEEAIINFQEALRLKPGRIDVLVNLGTAQRRAGQTDAAEASFRKALQMDPQQTEARRRLFEALSQAGKDSIGKEQWDQAIEKLQEAVRLEPASAIAHGDLGVALYGRRKLTEALAAFQQSVRLNPQDAASQRNLGSTLTNLGRVDESATVLREAVRLKPDYADAHWNLAFSLLLQGNLTEGMIEYEWRFQREGLGKRKFKQPEWDGSSPTGKTMLVYSDQGLGDMLQCVRYARLLKRMGAKVIVQCPPPLVKILTTCPDIDQVVAHDKPLPAYDLQAPVMSLPRIFRTTLGSIPAEVPYLSADPLLVEHWKSELAKLADGAFKVGIVWQGNLSTAGGRLRAIPLASFAPLTQLAGVRLFSLQKGAGSEQLVQESLPIIDLGSRIDEEAGPFIDTAAVMQNLDLVVTCDTATAHLAGALGVPVWVVLPLAPDWRWLLDREDSPWYPSARLFRQARLDDWDEVFQRVADELGRRLPPRVVSLPVIPTSVVAAAPAIAEVPVSAPPVASQSATPSQAAPPPVAAAPIAPPPVTQSPAMPSLAEAIKWHQAGDLDRAEPIYRELLRQDPKAANVWGFLANVMHRRGRPEQSIEYLLQAIALAPDNASNHCNLGCAYAELERYDEAIPCLERAVQLQSDLAEAHANLGTVLKKKGRLEEAVASLRRAVELKPQYLEARSNLANALIEQEEYAEGESILRKILEIRPNYADAYNNLGTLLHKQTRLEDARANYEEALRLQPKHAEAQANLGNVFMLEERRAEALACYDRALEIQPNHSDAHWNRALAWLTQGDMERGWAEYEWRWKQKDIAVRRLPQPVWDGSPLNGRTLAILSEQGLGDTLQFVRYAPLVQNRGGKVIFECHKPLLRLVGACKGIDQLVGRGDPLPPCDVQSPLLSLPRILGTTLENLPADVPYLFANPELIEHWRKELDKMVGPGFKIGINWQGNPKYKGDKYRSLPLKHFEPIVRTPGVHLFSLQKGAGSEQLAPFADQWKIIDLGSQLDGAHGAFMDTAAVMKSLDLVITSDTAMPHLAGGLGVPVWMAVPTAADWRWLLTREDCPWYPTMRMFRQRKAGEWDDVFQRIAEALKEHLAARYRNRSRARV